MSSFFPSLLLLLGFEVFLLSCPKITGYITTDYIRNKNRHKLCFIQFFTNKVLCYLMLSKRKVYLFVVLCTLLWQWHWQQLLFLFQLKMDTNYLTKVRKIFSFFIMTKSFVVLFMSQSKGSKTKLLFNLFTG